MHDVVALQTRKGWWGPFLKLAQRLDCFVIAAFGMTGDQIREGRKDEEEYLALIDLMQEANLVTSFHKDLIPYFELHTTTPVEYLPMCYPYSYTKTTYRKSKREDPPIIIVPGPVWNNEAGGGRDDACSVYVAAEIARRVPGTILRIAERPMHRPEMKDKADLPLAKYEETFDGIPIQYQKFESMNWPRFVKYAAECTLGVHCDWIWTTGRMCADLAAVGVPVIGGNSDHGRRLFPYQIGHNEWDADLMINFGVGILEDPDTYHTRIIRNADEWGLNNLDHEPWQKWMTELIETYR
jgi:hypothetical protein